MGRKIPAKKHRGVKDPLQQQAKRLQSLKNKINAPPKDPDEQPAPRSLERLFAFQNKDKNKQQKTKHKIIKSKGPGAGVGALRRLPAESGRHFGARITAAVRALHHDAPDHYPVEEADEEPPHRRRRSRAAPAEPALSRKQRMALKIKEKRDKAKEGAAQAGRELQYERVRFGEVAAAPPALRAPRRAPPAPPAPRPGRRSLLLSALLAAPAAAPAPAPAAPAPAERRRLERAREDAVAAYRALKAAKRDKTNKLAS